MGGKKKFLRAKSDALAVRQWSELPNTYSMQDKQTANSSVYVEQLDANNNVIGNLSSPTLTDSCGDQIYLNFSFTKSHKRSAIALLDTGADVNLISEAYLRNFMPYWRQMKDDKSVSIDSVSSVSGEQLKSLAIKKLTLHLTPKLRCKLAFVVMPDVMTYKCIIGRDIFVKLQASLMFHRVQNGSSHPGLCSDHFYTLQPAGQPKPVYLLHLALPGIFAVRASRVKLRTDRASKVYFRATINPFLTSASHCLITPSNEQVFAHRELKWLDTKCTPTFLRDGTVEFFMIVINTSQKEFTFPHITAHLELLEPGTEVINVVRNDTLCEKSAWPADNLLHTPTPAVGPLLRRSSPQEGGCTAEGGRIKSPEECRETLQQPTMAARVNMGPNKRHTRVVNSTKVTVCSGKNLCKRTNKSTYYCCNIRVHNGTPEPERFLEPEELLDEELMPPLELPKFSQPSVEEAFEIDPEDEPMRPYLEDIFLKNYREIIGTHSLDTGPVRYLGKIQLRTKSGMQLPKHTKVYSLGEHDQQHLNDILSFMVKYDFIEETFQDSDDRPSSPWGAPCYLIVRKHKTGFMRLIIDYSLGLNKILEPTPALVKGIEDCIEGLKGGYLFSLLDLKQSYYGLVLHPNSHKLTQFVAPPGRSFVWKRLPMGISTGPASLLEKVNLILRYVPKRDENGNVVFQEGEDSSDPISKAVLVEDRLPSIMNFYDDILVYTPKSSKPESDKNEESIKEHFDLVKRLAERMQLFSLKITFHKCSWGRRYVDFLGWNIRDNKLTADPKRIDKVRQFQFPTTRKMLQGFLGLVNTLKRVSPLRVSEDLALLSSIASTKEKYKYASQHVAAFERIKLALTTEPLYCHLVSPNTDKLLFVDASNLAYGSVLLSRMDSDGEKTFSSHINDNDPDELNQVILKWKLKLVIAEKYNENEDSLFKALLFLIQYHKLQFHFENTLEFRQAVMKQTRRSLIGEQIKEKLCNGNHQSYVEYLYERLGNVHSQTSATDAVLHIISNFLGRGLNVYQAEPEAEQCPLYEVYPEAGNIAVAPLNLGVYRKTEQSNAGQFVPLIGFRDWEFNPALLNSKYQINYYDSKIVPTNQRHRSILELEAVALLYALKKYRTFITNCNTYVITDNRSLYYLFAKAIVQSHAKISRYNMKLLSDYPNVKVLWCNSGTNLSDLFTRFGLSDEYENKIKFKAARIENLPNLPEGTILGWHDFATITECHPKVLHLLMDYSQTYNTKDKKKLDKIKQVYAEHQTKRTEDDKRVEGDRRECVKGYWPEGLGIKAKNRPEGGSLPETGLEEGPGPLHTEKTPQVNIITSKVSLDQANYIVKPILVLRKRMSTENIAMEQKHQLQDLYRTLLAAKEHKYVQGQVTFELIGNIIYCVKPKDPTVYLIVIPPTMEPLALALCHLTYGHTSNTQMQHTVKGIYYFMDGKMADKITNFCQCCTTCAINSRDTGRIALQNFAVNPDTRPFEVVCADLAENLARHGKGFYHLLIIKCISTSFTVTFPLKRKSNLDIGNFLLYGIFQIFGPIRALYTDNATIFRAKELLALFAALRIEVKPTVPLDSKSRGLIERTVRSVKVLMRKLMHAQRATEVEKQLLEKKKIPEMNFIGILPLMASLHLNAAYNSRIGNTPYNTVFGRNYEPEQLFSLQSDMPLLHPELRGADQEVIQVRQMVALENRNVASFIAKAQQRAKKSVKRAVRKDLPTGSLVFVLGQTSQTKGVSRAFQPYYAPSVWVVLKQYASHVMIMRVADRTVMARSKDQVRLCKQYDRLKELPPSVADIFQQQYTRLSQEQINLLAATDDFGPFKLKETDFNLPPDIHDGELQFSEDELSQSDSDSEPENLKKPLYDSSSDSDTDIEAGVQTRAMKKRVKLNV